MVDRLKDVLAAWPTGMAVVTAVAGEARHGITISSFSALSMDPPLVLWSLRQASPLAGLFVPGQAFAVNLLADGQQRIAAQFASKLEDRFCGVALTAGLAGIPLIAGCKAVLECATEAVLPGGDHRIVVGRVGRLSLAEDASPLIYCERRYLSRETLAA